MCSLYHIVSIDQPLDVIEGVSICRRGTFQIVYELSDIVSALFVTPEHLLLLNDWRASLVSDSYFPQWDKYHINEEKNILYKLAIICVSRENQ